MDWKQDCPMLITHLRSVVRVKPREIGQPRSNPPASTILPRNSGRTFAKKFSGKNDYTPLARIRTESQYFELSKEPSRGRPFQCLACREVHRRPPARQLPIRSREHGAGEEIGEEPEPENPGEKENGGDDDAMKLVSSIYRCVFAVKESEVRAAATIAAVAESALTTRCRDEPKTAKTTTGRNSVYSPVITGVPMIFV